MSINFRYPPNLSGGTEAHQLAEIRNFLYQLVEQLNWAMSVLESSAGTSGKPADAVNANPSEVKELQATLVKLSNSVNSTYSRLNSKIEKQAEFTTDIYTRMDTNLAEQGWYKLGVVSGDVCGLVTLAIGGAGEASPAMVDIATQNTNARMFLRVASLSDGQISKIGLIQESDYAYGVYAYYNGESDNRVEVNIHTHMGTFTKAAWEASESSEADMMAVLHLKE